MEVGSSTLPGTTARSDGSSTKGGLAQLARASALHAEGQRFESVILHQLAAKKARPKQRRPRGSGSRQGRKAETIFDMLCELLRSKSEFFLQGLALSREAPYERYGSYRRVMKKVSKGAWRMPWLSEAMKDVISCDKLREGANGR